MKQEPVGKRVLVICQHFWPEEFKINDICTSWVEMGYKVDVLCGIPNYPFGKYFEGYSVFKKRNEKYNGINIIRTFVIPRGTGNSVQIILNYISFPIFSIYTIYKLAKNNYDKIFVYQISPIFMAYPALLLKKLIKKDIYIYILDLWPESLFSVFKLELKINKYLMKKLSDNIYKNCDYFLSTSKGISEKIINQYNIEPQRVLYLPNWAEKLYEQRKQNKVLQQKYNNTFNIMFAGNIGPAQNFETILNAAKICYDDGYKDIKWIIVGDGMTKNWVCEQIDILDIKDVVDIVGRVPMTKMPEYYDIADVLLVALVKSELFSITVPAKIQSYLAAGKPIIASLDGEGAEVILESGAGYSCETGNYKLLASLVKKMYSISEDERKKMGENGYEYYTNNFEKEKLLKKLTNFIFQDNI